MKFRVHLKDPDGFAEGFDEAAKASLPEALDEDEKEQLLEIRRDKLAAGAQKWVEYGEYVTLEFDTTVGTCIVVEKGDDDG